jgi:hypothetical protein
LIWGFIWLLVAERLTISDSSIISRRYGRERSIPWHEASLLGEHPSRTTGIQRSIEVASRRTIICIRLSVEEIEMYTATNMTSDDAHAIMQHIAAKTGLPLYEL